MIAMTIPLMTAESGEIAGGWEWGADPNLWMYRARTVALLRKYSRLSVEVGRIPSLLGREFFRTQVTSYHMSTFEDVVIFVHDVERSLEKLDRFEQKLIAKIVLLEYTQEETARILGCGLRSVERHYPEALDRLSEIFLTGGLLRPMENPRLETCQEGEMNEISATCCEDCE
jgi:DNA-directed RNA polymerase specialized sigma24 family protein